MNRKLLVGKIHRATVTQSDIAYEGSITIDSVLMKAAGLMEFEQVHVANVDNGQRLETYAISGEAESGVVCLNGAAARSGVTGDRVIIMAYGDVEDKQARFHVPKVVTVDGKNKVIAVSQSIR